MLAGHSRTILQFEAWSDCVSYSWPGRRVSVVLEAAAAAAKKNMNPRFVEFKVIEHKIC